MHARDATLGAMAVKLQPHQTLQELILLASLAIGSALSAAMTILHSELNVKDATPRRETQKLFLAIVHKAAAEADLEEEEAEMLAVGVEVADAVDVGVPEVHSEDLTQINRLTNQNPQIRR